MPVKKVVIPIISAVSFSRLNDYRKCPQFAKFKHVDKLKEPGNKAMDRGSAIHKMAEDFTLKRIKKLPEELSSFATEFKELIKRKPTVEAQWAFDKDWNQVDWFDADVYCRVKIDCFYLDVKLNRLVVIDHKTGKLNDNHLEQLSLYALSAFSVFDTVDSVEVMMWYLDQGELKPDQPKIYFRSELPELKKLWNKNFKPITSDRRFAPKPSNACGWCFFSKAKSGPCKY